MSSLTFSRFDSGRDLRQNKSVADPNRFLQLKNAYTTPGYRVAGRPGATTYHELPPGTKGLSSFDGKLAVFATEAIPTGHANIESYRLDEPAGHAGEPLLDIHFADEFEGFLYVAAEYEDGAVRHHYLDGGPTLINTGVDDATGGPPFTKIVAKAANKIFAANGDTVKFCATAVARDWTTADDAGFLPTGNQHDGELDCTALGVFQRYLAVFFSDGLQLWKVDQDPALNVLANTVEASGTIYPRSVLPAFGDLFYLSPIGHRSVSLAAFEGSDLEDDVGAAIQEVVTPLLGPDTKVLGAFYIGGGQYITFIGTRAFVFTFSRVGKVSAWSDYEFAFSVDALTAVGGNLYLRSGDTIYILDKNAYTDDGETFEKIVQPPYLDLKKPGHLKQITGFDAVITGTCEISHRYNPNDESLETEPLLLSGDTRAEKMTPVELTTVAVSPVFRHNRAEKFELSSYTYLFEDLGNT